MLRSYQYTLDLNNEQKTYFNKNFGACRWVYNWCLSMKIRHHQSSKKSFRVYDLMNIVTKIKKLQNYQWLQEVNAQSLQESIRNLDTAYNNFFKHSKDFPKFKKRADKQSCKFKQDIYIDFENNKIKLPKIGWCKLFLDREFKGTIKSSTVSKIPCGKYFVSVLVETGVDKPEKCKVKKSTSIGIDVGLKTFATFSDGYKEENPKYLEKSLERLKVLQRRASKKVKGSNNRKKAFLKIAKIHYKITCQRKDFLHKLSSRIVSENQTIIIEDLHIEGMRKNRKLAKGISSASWSEFFCQLQYKCDWQGKNLIKIGRFEPSSKICNNCGCYNDTLTLSDRTWWCPNCDLELDRDINGAKNIRDIGLYQYLNNSGKDISRRERGVARDEGELRSVNILYG